MATFHSLAGLVGGVAITALIAAGCTGPEREIAAAGGPGRGASPAAAELVKLCESAGAKGDLALAEAACRRARELDPVDPAVGLAWARALDDLGAHGDAIREYQGVIAVRPADLDAQVGLGLAYVANGQYRLARAQLESALTADRANYRIHNALGFVQDLRGDHRMAQAHYRYALSLVPENSMLQANLARSIGLADGRIRLAATDAGARKWWDLKSRGPQPSPDLTAKVQQALIGLGYRPGGVDGMVGDRTVAAVRVFQTDTGFEPDGLVTELLLHRLEQALGRTTAEEDIPHGVGVLWKVEAGDAAPSYVFGTVHLSDPRVLALPDSVAQALAGAETVALEVVGAKELARRVLGSMQLPAERDLERILGPPLFAETVSVLSRLGFTADVVRRFKPWAAYVFLSLSDAELKRATKGLPGLDRWIEEEAERQGKRLAGLESIDEHLAVLDGMAKEVQVSVLAAAVSYADQTEQLQEQLTLFDLARNLAAIQRFMIEPAMRSEPDITRAFLERLIVARNRNWIKPIKALLADGNAFIAVGALHLPGETGILNLLAAEGYAISRVY